MGVAKISVLKDDQGRLILVDAKDIRFYDQDGYLEAEGGCTQPKREVKIKKYKKKCRGLYCNAESENMPEKPDKSMNVYVIHTSQIFINTHTL